MSGRILIVDDEPHVLTVLRRTLQDEFEVETAPSGSEALGLLEAATTPFAVILSDMRMPGMSGVEFLAQARERFPDTVRLMLTGYAGLETAMQAVNEGNVFRFLTKPCENEDLLSAVRAGMRQYELLHSERELLEDTLTLTVDVLTSMLSLLNPSAFGGARRVRRYVRHISRCLELPDAWQYEVAALLCQSGSIAVLPETMARFYAGEPLTREEEDLLAKNPAMARDLFTRIPRLEDVAGILAAQRRKAGPDDFALDAKMRPPELVGGQMLKTTIDFDGLRQAGKSPAEAIAALRAAPGDYDPRIVDALESFDIDEAAMDRRSVRVNDILPGMILGQDVRTTKGMLLLAKGEEMTLPAIFRMRSFWRREELEEQILILTD